MELMWLNSSAFWLLGLLGLTVLAHLIRRPPKERWAFGAMYLLGRVQHQNTKRSRVHDWILLLLRLLGLLLIGLAILRPEIQWADPNENISNNQDVVILVDTSLSMSQTLSELDSKTALEWSLEDIVNRLKDGSNERRYHLLSFDMDVEQHLPEWIQDPVLLSAEVSNIVKSENAGSTVIGLQAARRLFDGQGGEIWLYTDQAGLSTSGIENEIELLVRQNVSLIPQDIPIQTPSNLVITQANYTTGLEGGTLQFTVQNFAQASVEARCVVTLPSGTQINTFIDVPKEDIAESFVTLPRVTDGGIGSVMVVDDRLELDNRFYFHLPNIGASRVLLVDGDPGTTTVDSEVYYLERALSPSNFGAGIVPEIVSDLSAQSPNSKDHAVIFLANVANPSSNIGSLTEFVRSGGGLFISLGNNTDIDRVNQVWNGLLPGEILERKSLGSDLRLGTPVRLPTLSHPLFEPFKRGGLTGFSNVRWTDVFRLNNTNSEKSEVLLELENGLPLLVEHSVGKGKVLLLLGSIDMDGGNFPLQAVYMPLMQRVATYLGGSSSGAERLTTSVGESISISVPMDAAGLVWTSNNRTQGASLVNGKVSLVPDRSGSFELQIENGPTISWLRVNTDRIESDVTIYSPILEVAADVEPEAFIEKRDISKWLLLVGLVLFLLQAVIASKQGMEEGNV